MGSGFSIRLAALQSGGARGCAVVYPASIGRVAAGSQRPRHWLHHRWPPGLIVYLAMIDSSPQERDSQLAEHCHCNGPARADKYWIVTPVRISRKIQR